MTGRLLFLSLALLAAACATAKDGPGVSVDASADPIDAPGEPIDASTDPIDAPVDLPDGPPCVPTPEVCDGADNDCDNMIDDGNPGGGDACTTGMTGVCAAGVNQCMGGSVVCVQTNQPSAELCNGIDDDCNAATADGSAAAGFGQACDGADTDVCFEGTMTCNGVALTCGDATGNSVETNVVVDGGYEVAGAPAWSQGSTNFGSPLCTVAECGTGTGTGPRGGLVWNWLGGTTLAETSFTSQVLTIPVGTATLQFYFEIPVCAVGGTAEPFTVRIDGVTIYATNNSDAACGVVGYVLKSFNVNAFANGGSHTLEFRAQLFAGQATGTNFMVDDVRLLSCP